ncbi:DNA cytosine methyltransferase [Seohaeicola nanhaiensis]|uniref:DNA (cytosine-5-)-methyltransferase n=1 Tax=Seohaeicola nanhaiensis TaxID=1387282 RepID=A0ABV9KDW4_9RHOB
MTSLPLIIDSFAGGGGASTGIEMALGRSPDVAINHNAAALALHAANHPDTLHLDSNIWEVDPYEVAAGRHVGLFWASPDCKHFSKAKGGAPKDRNIRDLAWVVVDWAEKVKPDVICMENVEEFRTWGPVGEDGQPIKEFQGQTFELWIKRLRKAGYRVQFRELRGCDYGAATIRKRFFMVARRDGRPIVWPKPTHGDPNGSAVQRGKLLPWRTAAECIDWSLPCPSIFETREEILKEHGLRANRPLANNSMARIARGTGRYVLREAKPFVVSVAHGYSGGRREYSPDEPLGTATTRGVQHAVVAPSITRFNGGATGQDMRDPLATITANSWIKKPGGAMPLGMIAPSLMSIKGTDRRASQADAPHPTILAGGGHSSLIAPSLMRQFGRSTGQRTDAPAPTTVAGGGGKTAIVAPVLTYAQQGGRNRSAEDPLHTVTASNKDQNALIAPLLVQTGYGERHGQAPRSLDPFAPLGTVVAGGVKHAAAAVFLAQHNTGVTGHDARDPLSTVAQTGSHQTPVAAFLAKYYGAPQDPRLDEPLHTITTLPRFGLMNVATAAPPFTPDQADRARQVANFLRAHGEWDDREFVTIEIKGDTFVIVDIGMRMLTPRELFNAQGFPADYVIEGVWDERGGDWSFREFPKHVQISCCGNSVCPDVAAALVGANCGHLASAAGPERETADA